MTKLLLAACALTGGLAGCVVAPPYAYAPAPAYYAPGYAPGYYAAPAVGIGANIHIR